MKRSTFWRLFMLGYFGALVILVWTAFALIQDPPAPNAHGAFHCDPSWHLPCDEVMLSLKR